VLSVRVRLDSGPNDATEVKYLSSLHIFRREALLVSRRFVAASEAGLRTSVGSS